MAKKVEKKPTVDEILALKKDCETRYRESGVFDDFERADKFHELDFSDELNLPEEFKNEGVILPTGRDIIDTVVDHTDIFNPRVWTNRKGTSPHSEDVQELMRKFGIGVLYRNNVEASIAPLRVAAKHFWIYGLGVLKTVWDADRWMDKPYQKKGQSEEEYAKAIEEWRATKDDSIPIVLQAIHPSNIMFDPYTNGNSFVFETRDELTFDIEQKYPSWSNPKGKAASEKVEHTSFWSKFWRCELYDDEPVLKREVVRHSYGFIPYTPLDTGLGNITEDNDLSKRYVGVLKHIEDVLLSESRDYSIADVILKRNAFPWGYLKGQNAAKVTELFTKFGEYNPLPDDVEIVDMVPKMPPDALLTWLSVSAQYLASHAAPNSVRGMGETGVRSGADRRLLIAEASTRYQYANEAFRHGVAKVLSNCARIMKNVIPGNIHVWAETPTDEFDIEIDKAMMEEPFTFYVDFAPISEEDEYRRHDDLERLVKAGLVTVKWARKQMSNVDGKAMELEEEVERLKLDPQFQQIKSQYASGKLMEALTKRSQAEQVSDGSIIPPVVPATDNAGGGGAASGGGAGRRLVPPVPAPQDALQQQLASMRSQTPMSSTQGRFGGGS